MINTYKYLNNIQLTPHFNCREFKCKCTNSHDYKISLELITMLEKLYETLNCTKIIINSGFRCPSHDKHVGGNGSGKHTEGVAADIVCYNKNGVINSKIVCCIASDIGFTGVANISSRYQAVHVDIRTGTKYYGDEIHDNNSIWKRNSQWTDFYKYWNIKKEEVYKNLTQICPTCGQKIN